MELLDRDVYKMKDNEIIETKKVKDIVDPDQDVWVSKTGQVILKHEGILKLAEFVGATWDEPRKEDTPSPTNNRGFYYIITCRFPDGTSSFEAGEANDENTEKGSFSQKYKQSIAIKRGMDRSFLRSSYMKMYDIYSAEEADSFKQDRLKQLEEENNMFKTQLQNKNKMVQQMTEFVTLEHEDPKYPGTRVIDIWNVHKDEAYIEQLMTHQDPVIAWLAKGLLQKIHRSKKENTPTN